MKDTYMDILGLKYFTAHLLMYLSWLVLRASGTEFFWFQVSFMFRSPYVYREPEMVPINWFQNFFSMKCNDLSFYTKSQYFIVSLHFLRLTLSYYMLIFRIYINKFVLVDLYLYELTRTSDPRCQRS